MKLNVKSHFWWFLAQKLLIFGQKCLKLVKITLFGHFYQFLDIFEQKLAIFDLKATKNVILHSIS